MFNQRLSKPPTDSLRPINPDNAWGSRITAAAGTRLASPYSSITVTPPSKLNEFTLKHRGRGSSWRKVFYTPKGFFKHAASQDQAFAHCPLFSTAASRRSGVRVAVPLLAVMLSHRLPVIALVSLYLTNKLIGRGPFVKRYQKGTFTKMILIIRDH